MNSCKWMRHRLGTALTFSWHEWWILWQAWVLLLVVDLGLRVLPFRQVQKFVALARRDARDLQADEASVAIRCQQRLVSIAGRYHLYPMRCLPRALVLHRLLGQCGITTVLRIGVHKEACQMSAHAWLEYDGRPIGEVQGITAYFAPLIAQGAGR